MQYGSTRLFTGHRMCYSAAVTMTSRFIQTNPRHKHAYSRKSQLHTALQGSLLTSTAGPFLGMGASYLSLSNSSTFFDSTSNSSRHLNSLHHLDLQPLIATNGNIYLGYNTITAVPLHSGCGTAAGPLPRTSEPTPSKIVSQAFSPRGRHQLHAPSAVRGSPFRSSRVLSSRVGEAYLSTHNTPSFLPSTSTSHHHLPPLTPTPVRSTPPPAITPLATSPYRHPTPRSL